MEGGESAYGVGQGFPGGENDCGKGRMGGGSPRANHPIATPPDPLRLPGNLSRSREGEGGRIRSPGAGGKREAGPLPWTNNRGQTARIGPAAGWGGSWSGGAGGGSAVWGNYGGQTVQIPLMSFLEGSGGRGIRLGGGVLGAMGGSVGDEGIVRRSGLEWGQGRCPGEDQAFSSGEVVGPEGTGPFFRRALGELEPDGWGERMGAVEGRVSSRAASPCGPFRTIAGEGCGGGGERWRGRRRS